MDINNKFALNNFSNFLKILIVVAIIAGIILRFYNLDGKLYSNDETFSTTYIFGRDLAQGGMLEQRIVTIEELQNYQRVNPNESLPESINRIINRPYVFPPLYAILMQLWSRLWIDYSGSPAVVTRSLSVLISLFSLIGMYWLCWELSGSKTFAWIGTALIAISPFHLQYAQIVRTYSLTTVAILLSSASLLRSIRLNTKSSWIIYAATVTFGFYSNLLFAFVAIAHGAYTILREKLQVTKTVKLYLIATIIGFSLFLPWFILFVSKPGLLGYSVAQPVSQKLSLISLIKTWIWNIRPIFIDLNDPWREFTKYFQILQKILSPLIILLVGFSLYFVLGNFSKSVRIFTFCFLVFGGGLLMAKDAFLGGTFSVRLRYMIPYVLGLEIAVAYFICSQIESTVSLKKKLGEITLSILIVAGILSCVIIAQAESWSAFGAPDYPNIARKINQIEARPVVIFEDWGDALTMSYMLNSNVFCHLTKRGDFYLIERKEDLYNQFSDIIVFKPSKNLVDQLKKHPELKVAPLFEEKKSKISNVWKIKKS
jgi:uncharacterized membrane protein